jgi:Tetratricopeptide repeat
MNKNSELIMGVVVAALFLAIFVGLIYVLLKLLGRLFGFNRRKDLETQASYASSKTPTWVWIFVVAVIAIVTFLVAPRRKNAPPLPRPGFPIWAFLPPTFFMVVLFYWMRSRDPISSRAKLCSDAGDLDGAIEILREAIEVGKITAERANNLGLLYHQKKEPEQALKMFLDAAKLGADSPIYLANQAAALHDLGRYEDAAAILDDVCQKNPKNWGFAYSYGRVLISLRHFDEARVQIERAETLPIIGGNRSALAERARLIQECRALMAGKPTSTKPTGFEEL